MNTTTSLFALASLFAVTSIGCAAAPPVHLAIPAASAEAEAVETITADVEPEMAERTFVAMSARCRQDPRDRSESTRNHCIAATHLAMKVLHDADRAEALLGYRCEKFGASDRDNTRCAAGGRDMEARDGGN